MVERSASGGAGAACSGAAGESIAIIGAFVDHREVMHGSFPRVLMKRDFGLILCSGPCLADILTALRFLTGDANGGFVCAQQLMDQPLLLQVPNQACVCNPLLVTFPFVTPAYSI